MKLKLTLIIFIICFTKSFAGVKEVGNGGVVVVCKNNSGEIEKIQAFDLYEGNVLFNLIPKETGNDFENVAKEKLTIFSQLIDRDWENNLKIYLDNLLKNIKMLPSGVGLKLTEDIDSIIIPKTCEIAQLINYRNDGKIYVDSDLWNLLNPTDKAAMLVHEVLYYYLRIYPEPDSVRTRKMVAYLFSETPLQNIGIEGPQNSSDIRIQCSNLNSDESAKYGNLSFLVLKEKDKTKARFEVISGKTMISRSEVTFDDQDGLQELELKSMTESGIFITFYDGTPTIEKLYKTMDIEVKDTNYKIQYFLKISCGLRTWK